jgi:transcriptional regulator NrdR family protein
VKCSNCHSDQHRVIETAEADSAIRRRRKCDRCGFRWTTYERDESRRPQLDVAAIAQNVRSLQALISGEATLQPLQAPVRREG